MTNDELLRARLKPALGRIIDVKKVDDTDVKVVSMKKERKVKTKKTSMKKSETISTEVEK